MSPSAWAVAVALAAGTLRAVQLWRAAARVDVVNSVILTSLGEGRGAELSGILRRAGSGLYLDIAAQICDPIQKLAHGSDNDLRERLDRDARSALLRALRRLRRWAWLDHVALLCILFTGLGALTGQTPSVALTAELLAATLLWLSNLYGARSTATSAFAGATALVDGLIEARRHVTLPAADLTRSSSPQETE